MENLILVRATPEQSDTAIRQRYNPSGILTFEQHLDRAKILGDLPYELGRQITWVLVPRSDPTTNEILSTVVTIIRPVIVQRDSQSAKDSVHDDNAHSPSLETGFAICHVYTPPHLRKRGYATRMMTLLHAELDQQKRTTDPERSYPRGILSFLYSLIGDFYSRCGPPGWHIQSPIETYWNVETVLKYLPDDYKHPHPIVESEFKDIAQTDAKLLEAEFTSRSRDGKPPGFAILPTGEEFEWIAARSKYFGKILSPSSRPLPSSWGVRIPNADGGDEPDDFAVWKIDYRRQELHFLRIRCKSNETFRSIMYAAALAAKDQGCERVLGWNVDETFLEGWQEGEWVTRSRDMNMGAVAWYGGSSCPEWLIEEKYGWC